MFSEHKFLGASILAGEQQKKSFCGDILVPEGNNMSLVVEAVII
jgi:hypothetical protein